MDGCGGGGGEVKEGCWGGGREVRKEGMYKDRGKGEGGGKDVMKTIAREM